MRHLGRMVFALLLAVNGVLAGLLLLSAYSPYVDPVAHPLRSCLGLAFPVFLLADVLFLVFWLALRCWRAALLPLAAVLLCSGQVRTYFPLRLGGQEVPEGSIKLLSYNVMCFGWHRKADGPSPILEYLGKSGADVLCLQEYLEVESSGYLSRKDIEKALSAYPYHCVHAVGKARRNHVACYSKFPILSARRLEYGSSANGSVAYKLKVGKDTLTLINNHLESNKLTAEDKSVYVDMLRDPEAEKVKSGIRLLAGKLAEASALRAPQADSIAAETARCGRRRVVVCGDFNDSPVSYTHRVACEGMKDAFVQSGCGLGISYNRNRFYFRIDHILYSPDLQAYRCTVDRSIKASDHYPIWCYLSWRS